jgi:hypothetical protein
MQLPRRPWTTCCGREGVLVGERGLDILSTVYSPALKDELPLFPGPSRMPHRFPMTVWIDLTKLAPRKQVSSTRLG